MARMLLIATLLLSSWAHAAPQTMQVRVRLHKEMRALDITGSSLQILPASDFVAVGAPPEGTARAKIVRNVGGVWTVQWDGGPQAQRIEGDRLWVKGRMLRVGRHPVPYELELHGNGNKMDVIARLDLETYLMGVLPAEMPLTWPMDALKAQAVAARSFVMRSAHERLNRHFDVDSTIIDQVYKFLAEAEQHPDWKLRLTRAVRETRGEVLIDSRHRILKAFYSADCGCQTEDPKFVWGRSEGFVSVKDPSCQSRRPASWELRLDRGEVRARLISAYRLPGGSTLKALHVSGRTPSGRVADVVAAMNVEGATRNLTINSQEFRRIFGFQRIRSTDFSLRWIGDGLEILGAGVGHGVGMCQSGARSLADQGMGYREILRLYYPKAQLWTLKRT